MSVLYNQNTNDLLSLGVLQIMRNIGKSAFFSLSVAVLLSVSALGRAVFAGGLEFLSYDAQFSGVGEKSVIILGEKQAVLIDAQWKLSDAKNVAGMILDSGRELTHVLISHGHPDHYWGLAAILEQFPQAQVLARQGTRDEIANQFAAKWIHWQPLFGDDVPTTPVVPEVFEGDTVLLEDKEIRVIDLPANEVEHSVAYYVPSEQALIAGDLIFSRMHSYFADLSNPSGWIEALELVKTAGPIKTVYPGHGPNGDASLIDDTIHYMQVYQSYAKPGVPLPDIIRGMTAAFPDYGGEMLLWWTRGPGFGIFGPRSLGVPEPLIAGLPPHLVGPAPGCSAPNKALVEKLFLQGFSGGNMAVLDEVIAENFRFSYPGFPDGLDGLKAIVQKNNASFEDWHFQMHDTLCDGDKVTVRWSGQGKHVASFMGEAPTGNQVELTGISIFLIENNKIIADWAAPDNLDFLQQLGVLSTPDMSDM